MTGSLRRSTITYDGGGSSSIVEQTTDIINRVRHSIVRSRQERFLDEDLQAIDQIVNRLHLTELINKETLGKLISQGNSIERSYHLINQLENDIQNIAEDLNEVNGRKCCGTWKNGTCFGLKCLKKKKNQRNQNSHQNKSNQIHLQSLNQKRLSSATERQEILDKTRALAEQRREHPDFVQILNQLNQTNTIEIENREKQINQLRDYLLQNHSLTYGYIDQPDRLVTEIDMAIQFNQINTHLDHLLQTTENVSDQINKHNNFISKIQTKAMESGNLLTDYTLLGHHILGTSTIQNPTLTNLPKNDLTTLGISTGQKVLLDSVL